MGRTSRGKEGFAGKRRARVQNTGPRKKARCLEGMKVIRLNDHDFMRKFLTDHGKIMPSRLTGTTAKQQRRIKKGIRRARTMGLMP